MSEHGTSQFVTNGRQNLKPSAYQQKEMSWSLSLDDLAY